MHPSPEKEKAALDLGDCLCPDDVACFPTASKPSLRLRLRRVFGKCASCASGGGIGFLAGHAGCLVTPALLAAVGATTATADISAIALAFGAAATAGGLYAWRRLRGKTAGRIERTLVLASALTGLGFSSVAHLSSHAGHPRLSITPEDVLQQSCCGASCPTDSFSVTETKPSAATGLSRPAALSPNL